MSCRSSLSFTLAASDPLLSSPYAGAGGNRRPPGGDVMRLARPATTAAAVLLTAASAAVAAAGAPAAAGGGLAARPGPAGDTGLAHVVSVFPQLIRVTPNHAMSRPPSDRFCRRHFGI